MKQLSRARWLLIAIMLLGVFGANAQETWYLFDSYITDRSPRATFTDPDADGNYVLEFTSNNSARENFAFTNNLNPTSDSENTIFLGSASGNVTVTSPGTFDLTEIDHGTFYSDRQIFTISDGDTWIITFNPTAKKVTFSRLPAPELPEEAPETLFLVDYDKSFAEASNNGNGIFEFQGVRLEANRYPYYGFCDTSNPRSATVMASAQPEMYATSDNNVTITYNETYPLALSSWSAIDGMVGSFVIPEGFYDITVKWTERTVTCKEGTEPAIEAPEKLYLVDWTNSFAEATNDGNGIFSFEGVSMSDNQYPFYAFANSATPNAASMILCPVSAEEADATNNVYVAYEEEYPLSFSNWDNINECKGCFVINPGIYNITLDWNTRTVIFTQPKIEAPDVLYIIDYQTSFGSAINNGEGIYEFEDITLTSGFPYYGFAPTEVPNEAPWALGTVDYATAKSGGTHAYNIDVVYGEEYTFEFSDAQAMYDEVGSFVLGTTPCNITLDWNNKTVKFYTKPLEQPARLYATDTYLEDLLGSCVNNGNGVFNMVVDVEKSSSLVVFTSTTDFKNTEGETNYYGTADGKIADVQFETPYTLGLTDYNTVWGDQTGLLLPNGRYKIDIDFNECTIVAHDIARGDIWTIPETLNIYTDDMAEVALGERIEEGVFQFNDVAITKATNVVFTDNPTATGKFFGSSMKGDRSIDVKNYRTYDLYIPTYQEIVIDGLAGFRIPEGTWSIKVDLNEKTVSFVDPSSAYFPEQLAIVKDSETTSNTAEGTSSYTWKLTLAAESEISFSDPLTGRTYGSPAADVAVEAGVEYEAGELNEEALNAFKVPAGTWEVVFDLKKGKVTFYEYQAISLVESTYKDGDKFYSYYGAGTDPMMVLTFTGNPFTVAEAYLALGDYTPGSNKSTETCTIEKVSMYRSGNTLFTSFAGMERSIPEGAEPKVTLVVSTIKSVHGLVAETEAIEGLPAGSLMFTFDFEEFQPIVIESKLLDAEGNEVSGDEPLNVDETESFTLMVKPFNLITFDGVVLTRGSESQAAKAAPASVALNWEAGEADADGFTPVYVNVPMSIRGAGTWNLSLSNLNADDNTGSHGDEVNYTLESLVHPADVVKADPENGTIVKSLQDIILTWNHSLVKSVGYNGAKEPELTVTGNNGETYPASLKVISPISDNELLIHIESEIKTKGTYTIVIPAGTIVLNDDKDTNANAIELEYEVSGTVSVSDILADDPDAEVTVCTLSGMLLFKGRAADVLTNLGEGLYIINGEKIYIR